MCSQPREVQFGTCFEDLPDTPHPLALACFLTGNSRNIIDFGEASSRLHGDSSPSHQPDRPKNAARCLTAPANTGQPEQGRRQFDDGTAPCAHDDCGSTRRIVGNCTTSRPNRRRTTVIATSLPQHTDKGVVYSTIRFLSCELGKISTVKARRGLLCHLIRHGTDLDAKSFLH